MYSRESCSESELKIAFNAPGEAASAYAAVRVAREGHERAGREL